MKLNFMRFFLVVDIKSAKIILQIYRNIYFFFFRTGTLVLQEQELFKKVKLYNDYMENNKTQRLILTSREVNGRLVLEGVLRIFWGLHHSIRVKEEHDLRPIIMRKKSSKGKCKNQTC